MRGSARRRMIASKINKRFTASNQVTDIIDKYGGKGYLIDPAIATMFPAIDGTGSKVTKAGDAIGQINDVGPAGRVFSSGVDAYRPTFSIDAKRTWLDTLGGLRHMRDPNGAISIPADGGFSLFVGFRSNATSSTRKYIFDSGFVRGSGFGIGIGEYIVPEVTNNPDLNTRILTGVDYCLEYRFIAGSYAGTYINGVERSSISTGVGTSLPAETSADPDRRGCSILAQNKSDSRTTRYFNGRLYLLSFIPAILTNKDRAIVTQYVAQRSGIYI